MDFPTSPFSPRYALRAPNDVRAGEMDRVGDEYQRHGRALSQDERRLDRFMQSIDVGRVPMLFPIKMKWEFIKIEPYRNFEMGLRILMRVPDRENPDKVIDVAFSYTLLADALWDEKTMREIVLRFVRNGLRDVVLHEVDEHLYVDGVRLFDPHKGDGPPRPAP